MQSSQESFIRQPRFLILTALVINFGVLAFAMVLVKRAYQEVGNDDLNEMRTTDT